MGFFDFVTGKPEQFKQKTLHTKEQQQALIDYLRNPINQTPLYESGQNYIQQLLSNQPGAYEAFEKPYMQNFEQNIAPQIAERFAAGQGYGGTGGGALYSSGFQNSIAQAGANLQAQLAALRGGLQMQALPEALTYAQQPYSNLYNALNVRPFENIHMQRQPGLLEGGSSGFAQGGGLPGFFGGGGGGDQGASQGGGGQSWWQKILPYAATAVGGILGGPAGAAVGGAAGSYFGGR